MHQFDIQGVTYLVPHPDDDPGMPSIGERGVPLNSLLTLNLQLEYLYDFGDSWRHRIIVGQVKNRIGPMV